ncbi:MAG: hypothetical protein ACJ8LN_12140 [Sulfurifustis sp.]
MPHLAPGVETTPSLDLKTPGAGDIVRRVTKRRLTPRFFPWLFAMAFLAVQAITFVHELKHDLHQHDDTTCVLHLHTKHSGHVDSGIVWYASHGPRESPPSLEIFTVRSTPAHSYDTRAPPFRSQVAAV